MSELDRAAAAIETGKLVVYPTETVYGLGADALDPAAVEAVFAAKRRERAKPISLAVASVAAASAVVRLSDRERQFADRFLPGPVTLLCERRESVPDVLVAGRDRVGLRVPDCEFALSLAERTGPITATSANVSGRPAASRVDELDAEIRERAAVVVDGGETPGSASTVVDVSEGRILRAGLEAGTIREWLDRAGHSRP